MIESILHEYSKKGNFPYDEWPENPESFFLLQNVWLDILSDSGTLLDYQAGQQITPIPESCIVSLKKKDEQVIKHVMIYTIESTEDYNFNFYLKPILHEGGILSDKDTTMVADAKLEPRFVRACIDIVKEFETARITSSRSRDLLYDQLYAKYGNLLAYTRD